MQEPLITGGTVARELDMSETRPAVENPRMTMPGALISEIERVQALLDSGAECSFNRAAMRTALNDARDLLGKFHKLEVRVVRGYHRLREIK